MPSVSITGSVEPLTTEDRNTAGTPPIGANRAPVRRHAVLQKRIAITARWLHIYLSMVSFAVVLFFSITGLTLNHADKLSGHERVAKYSGILPAQVMQASGGPDQAVITQQLRTAHHIRGAVTDFRNDADQTSISFKGAGYNADAFIERPSGRYQVIETRSGTVAMLNDLHRGVVTGKVWSLAIDASAVLLVLVSLTGLALIFFLYKKRTSGLIVATAGGIVLTLLIRLFVP